MAGHEGRSGTAQAATAARQGRTWRRGDLEAPPFPEVPEAAAADPAVQRETLARLRAWAEQDAEAAIDWYLRDKRLKRVGSRLLQGFAIAFAVAGTAVPLGTAAYGGSGQGWGYVLLAVAAGCKAFDHFFGVSAAWMRDITVAHALRTELNAVRLEWAADVLRAGPRTDPPGRLLEPADVERQLALVHRLAAAVRSHVDGETAEWQAEFSSSTRQLQGQGGLPAAER
ncbi:SLATT domain-containing protein [Actinacidiphila bryophytorum]|uniref:SLATT domain-containing protein n=1 Tax=Actinacidiphila bryophytorum TaxID=1436133 RepID=UPI002176E4D5|nr:SLATT domain-containing protein [Actinacidiphila bryophytorum]UWE11453.1 SLATT domain-containing protein [Actinacidiphila bryophytorum]